MKLAFHTQHFSERGTSIAIYDYAFYYQEIYNGCVIFLYKKNNPITIPIVEKKFLETFECHGYSTDEELEELISFLNITHVYHLVYGLPTSLPKGCKNLIHSVFDIKTPYGDRYAAISEVVSKGRVPVVPHIVNLPKVEGDLRSELNIPSDAIVAGRHGGYYSFDIPYVFKMIKRSLDCNDKLHYIFLNTKKELEHPRVHYLETTWDLERKVKFINSCDIMIHASFSGETFGLSVAEFSFCNKPIITNKSEVDMHIRILKDKAFVYSNEEELFSYLVNIPKLVSSRTDWNAYKDYNPENVMFKFVKEFLL